MGILFIQIVAFFLAVLVALGIGIRVVMVGWKRAATQSAPGNKCERCSDGALALTWVPRRSRWVRALGYVIVVATLYALSLSVLDSLQIVRSGSIDSGLAEANIVMMVFVAAPFLLLGGFLAFPFRKNVWRCTSCGHILDQPRATHIGAAVGFAYGCYGIIGVVSVLFGFLRTLSFDNSLPVALSIVNIALRSLSEVALLVGVVLSLLLRQRALLLLAGLFLLRAVFVGFFEPPDLVSDLILLVYGVIMVTVSARYFLSKGPRTPLGPVSRGVPPLDALPR